MRFFTADTHFDHGNIVSYCNRPFSCKEEMNEAIVANWNSVVRKGDTVYHLGDFSFSPPHRFLSRLNGTVILVRGNHDHSRSIRGAAFHEVHDILTLNMGPRRPNIVLCHYAMLTWPSAHRGAWHLFGHSHGTLQGVGRSFDVGVDCNNFTPISLEEVAQRMTGNDTDSM